MNKLFTRISMALVGIAMAVGVGVAVGGHAEAREVDAVDDVTVKWTASQNALGTTISTVGGTSSGTINTVNASDPNISYSWSYTRTLKSGTDSVGWNANSAGCIQLGKNGGIENIVFTTSQILGTIKSVSFEGASYNGSHKISISVGSTAYKSNQSTTSWGSGGNVGTVTGTGTSSGAITINITNGSRALYIKSITVVYSPVTVVASKLLLNDSESFDALVIDGNNEVSTKNDSITYEVQYDGQEGLGKVTTSVVNELDQATSNVVIVDDDNGTLTITAKINGVYTLTVATVDKDSTSNVIEREVTITVQNLLTPVFPARVNSTNGLSIGDKVYLVHETSETAAGPLDGTYMTAVDVTLDDGTMTDEGDALAFTLGRNGSNYTFRYDGNLLGIGASKNQVYINGNGTTTFTLTFDGNNAAVASTNDSSNKIQYNNRFSNYTSSQSPIQLYVMHASDKEVAEEFEDNYLVMGSDVAGQCNTYYENAKSTFATLTDGQKAKLSNAALARLHAWAAAKGDNFNIEDKAFAMNSEIVFETSKSDSSIIIISIISAVSLVAVSSYFVIRRRKENN